MSRTDTINPEFLHTLSLVLNSAVSVAYAQYIVNTDQQEDYTAARHLGMLQDQYDTLCKDLYQVTPPGVLNDLLDDLDNAITHGDTDTAERIRDRELAKFSPEVTHVRDVNEKIKYVKDQINILHAELEELEEERVQKVVTAVESGIAKEQVAAAIGRDVVTVNRWLLGV